MNSGADGGTGLRGSTITLIAVLVGVAVIGTASLFRPETAPQEEEVALAAPEAEAPLPDDPAPAADEAMETEASDPDPDPEADTPAPRFDQIRVAPDGATVIAGQAPEGARVTFFLDGTEIAETVTSGAGDFAAIMTLPPSDAPRIMSLVTVLPDGSELPGQETVIIAPFGVVEGDTALAEATPAETTTQDDAAEGLAEDAPVDIAALDETLDVASPAEDMPQTASGAADADSAPVGDETTTDVAEVTTDTAAPDDAAPEGTPAVAAAPEETGPEEPVLEETMPEDTTPETTAPAIVVAGADGVRVVQGGAPQVQDDVRIDAITYSTEGAVTLAGRGASDRQVQVLLNNRPIQMGEIGPEGQWSLELPDVDPGTYTLTVTQLSPEGAVESRVDTPFLREDPARVAASPMRVADGVSVITVQPGFTLWGIAEANFGDGIAYVQIFQENRESIRDPDLIFPGQIFQLPDLPREAAEE
jgi:nucleoid-associated protein YgaU